MTAVRPTLVPAEIATAMGAEPTDEQWDAIAWPLEPCVLVAGAGSGKTSVMAARVVYLALAALGRIEGVDPAEGVLPGNVLCLTFTNKATENLRLRVRRALAALELPEGEEPEILNYHGFAASLLERYGVLAGFEPGARVLTQAQRSELCGRVLDEMTFEHASATWQPSLVTKILELDDQAQNHRVTPPEIEAHVARHRLELLKNARSNRVYTAAQERIELAHAAGRYRELKRELGVIDFGDQIDRAISSRHAPSRRRRRPPRAVPGRAAGRVPGHERRAGRADVRRCSAHGHPVMAVGDPDQNIYAWRGASLYNLLGFPAAVPPGATAGPPRGCRCTRTSDRGPASWRRRTRSSRRSPRRSGPTPTSGSARSRRTGDGEVRVARVHDEWTEARAIARAVSRLHEDGARWSEVAVLCRTSRLFGLLQRAFDEHDVPVEIVGLAGLLKQPEVVEVLAYARAVLDPKASVALARILLGPRYRVGFKDWRWSRDWRRSRARRCAST